MYSTTAKVLLDGNRMVHSRNVTHDIYDYGQDTVERPSPEAIKDNAEVDTFHNLLEDITQGDYTKPGPSAALNPETRTEEPLTVRGVRGTEDAEERGASPAHDLGGSESDPEDKCVDVEVDLDVAARGRRGVGGLLVGMERQREAHVRLLDLERRGKAIHLQARVVVRPPVEGPHIGLGEVDGVLAWRKRSESNKGAVPVSTDSPRCGQHRGSDNAAATMQRPHSL